MKHSVMTKLRLRELFTNFKSYISILMISLLCVALFTGLYANYKNFDIKVQTIYERTNAADFFITTDSYDESDLEGLKESIPEIDDIQERLYIPIQEEARTFSLIGVPEDNRICVPEVIDGNEGVLVSSSFLSNTGHKVGDHVTLKIDIGMDYQVPERYVRENEIDTLSQGYFNLEFTIDGEMYHPEDIEKHSVYSGMVYMDMDVITDCLHAYFDKTYRTLISEVLKKNFTAESFINQYVIKTDEDISDQVNQYFLSKSENNLLSALKRDSFPTNSSIENDVTQAHMLLYVFPVVFYLVGVLIIITSEKELILKERKNIGTMYSLGLPKWKIVTHYTLIPLIVVTIGSLLGNIIGPLLIPNVMGIKYGILYNLADVSLPWFYLPYLAVFFIIVLLTVFFGVLLTLLVLRRSPSEILRGEESYKHSKALIQSKKKSVLPFRMSIRNMFFNISRSVMVLLGVMGCSALLVCGFGISDTLDYSVAQDTVVLIPYDIVCTYSSLDDMKLVNDSDIDKLDLYQKEQIIALSDEKTYNTAIYIFENEPLVFSAEIPADGCLVSTKIAEDLSLDIGDDVSYIVDDTRSSLKVQGIVDASFTNGLFVLAETVDGCTPNGAFMTCKDNVDVAKFKEELYDRGATNVTTMDDTMTSADDILSGISGITMTVKVFAILLALVVIYNLAQLNYKERIRDIATLKVLGFGKKEIAQVLLYELTILTLVGAVIGLFVGRPLMILLLSINETSKFTYIYHISLLSYGLAILLTLVISIIINLFLTFLSDRIKMVESLKSVE